MKLLRIVFVMILNNVLLFMPLPAQSALPIVIDQQALPSLAPMLEKTMPGVVNIATRGSVRMQNNPLLEDPFFRRFFNIPNQPLERQTQSLGSGVIVNSEKGYILTNNHVIESADEISITTHDGQQYVAKVIGTDPDSDIAVLEVEASNLSAVPWGDSERLRVGDFVIAIGNPFGLGQTVTSGIVSALGRSGLGIEAYEDFIQTDASINPGNSGGALVDLNGKLIGINTAIIGPSGGNVGIGFAIPSVMAKQIMQQLIEFGEVKRGALGVVVQDLSTDLIKAFNLDFNQGVVITQVEKNSPAAKAGLMTGDVILEINRKPIKSSAEIRNKIGLQRIGQIIEMTVLRNSKKIYARAEIKAADSQELKGDVIHPQLTGAKLSIADTTRSEKLISVIDIARGSPAAQTGIQKGDLVISVNRQRVQTIEDVKRAVNLNRDAVLLNIQRGNSAMFLVLR